VRKPERNFPLIPILGAVAAAMILALAALLLVPPLFRGTPTPAADTPAALATTAVIPVTEPVDLGQTATAAAFETGVAAPPETAAAVPAETPAPAETVTTEGPTATLKPPPTATSKPTRANTPAPIASDTPAPTAKPDYQPPELLKPPADDSQSYHGPLTFRWSYSGEMGPDDAFQVLIWQEGDASHNGAFAPTQEIEQEINLDEVDRLVLGEPGPYLWSVVVVDSTGDERLGPEASPREFVYAGPQ
jgi:hypothetical protein